VSHRFTSFFKRKTTAAAPPVERSEEARAVQEAFWIVLGREVGPIELRDQLRGFRPADVGGLVVRLLSSPEFRLLYQAWQQGEKTGRDLRAEEKGLRALGSDDWFVRCAYDFLLGRPADEGGLRHCIDALATGEKRVNVLRSLVLSGEFEHRYRRVAPQGGFVPRDTQLCELANPAKWDNPEWLAFLRDLQVLPDEKVSMHRKTYEFTQLLYGMHKLGLLRDDVSVLSVGAGHEAVLYWLANHVRRVVATDLYEGIWQTIGAKEGDEQVIQAPEEFSPFPYRRDRLTFLKMDGRRLAFKDGMFDVVYSLSSIEHFGGQAGAETTLDEMARVLKPGGLVALATEYVIAGPPHEETFQPQEMKRLLERPGLRLVQPVDDRVYDRYEYMAVDLYKNPHQTPHMVVRFEDTVFTTVMAFLRKG
jgi:ubiquinone/menaquinone biosynthesis C-methylase UbiE